jgi:hypothetical protein
MAAEPVSRYELEHSRLALGIARRMKLEAAQRKQYDKCSSSQLKPYDKCSSSQLKQYDKCSSGQRNCLIDEDEKEDITSAGGSYDC